LVTKYGKEHGHGFSKGEDIRDESATAIYIESEQQPTNTNKNSRNSNDDGEIHIGKKREISRLTTYDPMDDYNKPDKPHFGSGINTIIGHSKTANLIND
jgi:hypothetical protein